MPEPRDTVLNMLNASERAVLRKENSLVKAIYEAFDRARKEILAELADAYAKLGPNPDTATIQRLANDLALANTIRRRMTMLEAEFSELMLTNLRSVVDDTTKNVLSEIRVLAENLGISVYGGWELDPVVQVSVQAVVEQVPAVTAPIAANLLAEMRTSLARGDRMADIAKRALARDGSIFSRGLTSAELFARRAVIQANTNARLYGMQQAKQQVPELKKQAVAAISSKTTKLCLRVHGQIQDIDKPFELARGEPAPFQRKMMGPPFHWNCRTSVVPYHPKFESGNMKTSDMKSAAAAELKKR